LIFDGVRLMEDSPLAVRRRLLSSGTDLALTSRFTLKGLST